jgi:hypothetical protein
VRWSFADIRILLKKIYLQKTMSSLIFRTGLYFTTLLIHILKEAREIANWLNLAEVKKSAVMQN